LYVIPKGAAALGARGEGPFGLPAQLHLQLGIRDILVLRNEDDRQQQLGPVVLAPGQTYRLPFHQPGAIQLACSFHQGSASSSLWPHLRARAGSGCEHAWAGPPLRPAGERPRTAEGCMRTAFVVFDRMTALDFVGIYDPLTRLHSMGFLPDFAWEVCAQTPEVADDRGLRLRATAVGGSLAAYDLLVVPGGVGTRLLLQDAAFLAWLRTAAPVALKVSVCTGALLLGAAGFLQGRRATTHPSAVADLAPFCHTALATRLVDEGAVITAGGSPPLSTSGCSWSTGSRARRPRAVFASKWTTPIHSRPTTAREALRSQAASVSGPSE